MDWETYAARNKYSDKSDDERAELQKQYFLKNVAPGIPASDVESSASYFKNKVADWEKKNSPQIQEEYRPVVTTINDTLESEKEKSRKANTDNARMKEAYYRDNPPRGVIEKGYSPIVTTINDTIESENEKIKADDTPTAEWFRQMQEAELAKRQAEGEERGMLPAFKKGVYNTPLPNVIASVTGANKNPNYPGNYETNPDSIMESVAESAGNIVGLFAHAPTALGALPFTIGGALAAVGGGGLLFAGNRMASHLATTKRDKGEYTYEDMPKTFKEGGKGLAEGTAFGSMQFAGRGLGKLLEKPVAAQLERMGFQEAAKNAPKVVEKIYNKTLDMPVNTALGLGVSRALDGELTNEGIATSILMSVFPGMARTISKGAKMGGGAAAEKVRGMNNERKNRATLAEIMGVEKSVFNKALDNPDNVVPIYEEIRRMKEAGEIPKGIIPEDFTSGKFEETPAILKGEIPIDELAKKYEQTGAGTDPIAMNEFGDVDTRVMVQDSANFKSEAVKVPQLPKDPKSTWELYLDTLTDIIREDPDAMKKSNIANKVMKKYVSSWGRAVSDASRSGGEIVKLGNELGRMREMATGKYEVALDGVFGAVPKKDYAFRKIAELLRMDDALWSKNMGDIPEAQRQPILSAAAALRELNNIAGDTISASGLTTKDSVSGEIYDFAKKKNYLHQEWDMKKIKKIGEDVVLKDLVSRGLINADELPTGHTKWTAKQASAYLDTLRAQQFGGIGEKRADFQYRSKFDMPIEYLNYGPDMYYKYFTSVADRVSQAELLGPKNELMVDLVTKAKEEIAITHDRKAGEGALSQTDDLAKRITGEHTYDPYENAIVRAITNFQTLTKMGLAVFSQGSQAFMGMSRGGVVNWTKGVYDLIAHHKDAEIMTKMAGVNLKRVQDQLMGEVFGPDGTLHKHMLRWNGFKWTDMLSRKIAALTGFHYVDDIVLKADKKMQKLVKKTDPGMLIATLENGEIPKGLRAEADRLNRLGLDANKILLRKFEDGRVNINETERLSAGRQFEVDTNFRAYAQDLPQFASTEMGKLVTQFKSFSYLQTKFLRDHIWHEAVYNRNLMPVITLVAAGLSPQAVFREMKNVVSSGMRYAGTEKGVIAGMIENSPIRQMFYPTDEELSKADDKMAQKMFGRQGAIILNNLVNYASTAGVFGMGSVVFDTILYKQPQLGPTADAIISGAIAAGHTVARKSHKSRPMVEWALKNLIPLGNDISKNLKQHWKESDYNALPIETKMERTFRGALPQSYKDMEKMIKNYGKPEKSFWETYGL
jgi:hypothetical protein